MYALYTSVVPSTMCGQNITDEGVYLGGAKLFFAEFIQTGKKRVTESNLLKRATPLSCILGCPLRSNEEDPAMFFERYYPTEILSNQNRATDDDQPHLLGFYSDIPGYVLSLLQLRQERLPDWWLVEHGRYVEGVNAIVIHDARQ
jgi:hypothetical protein